MSDFRLQVFQTAAKRLSFTKAASELFITQPAVTKHIHELEKQFKATLFERNGGKIKLTAAGEILLQHTEEIFSVYRNIEAELSQFSQKHKGKLRLGASTTVAQYVLPPVLAMFHKKFPGIQISLTTHNTEHIELALIHNEIDLGIIEGHSKNTSIKYTEFLEDEIVLVTSSKNLSVKKAAILPKELPGIKLLMREAGSGTLEVIRHTLKNAGIRLKDLQIEMELDGTESMKSYLLHSECMAFVSIYSVLNELQKNELRIIDIKSVDIKRHFYFIQLHGRSQPLPELFMSFASRHNFR